MPKEAENTHRQTKYYSYIRRHWRGELPLAKSFWINTVLVITVTGLLFTAFKYNYLSFDDVIVRFPTLFFTTAIVLFPLSYALLTWQLVGLWRSAGHHASASMSSTLGRAAQIVVILFVFYAISGALLTGFPQIIHYAKIVLGLDQYTHFTVRILLEGTELEILGGIGFGLTSEVKKQLDDNPNIRLIHMNSIGGRIVEARQLRLLIASKHLITYSSRGCLSACVYAFLAGESRVLRRDARLGFHQPVFPGVTLAQMENVIGDEKTYFL